MSMKFIRKLSSQGVNSITGVVNFQGAEYIFKLPRNIDFIILHEYFVLKDLEFIASFCPNFPRPVRIIKKNVKKNFYENSNPLEKSKNESDNISIECILLEYVEGYTLYEMLMKRLLNQDQLFSCIMQLIMALMISGDLVDFTHYDMHLQNIILRKTDKTAIKYRFKDSNIVIPTFGYIPVFIDFGLSYSRGLDNKPICAALDFTNIGCLSVVPAKSNDLRFFLNIISKIMSELDYINPIKSGAFAKLVQRIYPYQGCRFELNGTGMSAMDYIGFVISNRKPYASNLFTYNHHGCIQLIKYLIPSPPDKQPYYHIISSYTAAAEEFAKIENLISDGITNMHIFKEIVKLWHKKMNGGDEDSFVDDAFKMISSHGDFCYPKDMDIKRLGRAIELCSKCISGIIYSTLVLTIDEMNYVTSTCDIRTIFKEVNNIHSTMI